MSDSTLLVNVIEPAEGNSIVELGGAAVLIPAGSTAERPQNSPVGTIRYNTEVDALEVRSSSEWQELVSSNAPPTTVDFSQPGPIGTEQPNEARFTDVTATELTVNDTLTTTNLQLQPGTVGYVWTAQDNQGTGAWEELPAWLTDPNLFDPATPPAIPPQAPPIGPLPPPPPPPPLPGTGTVTIISNILLGFYNRNNARITVAYEGTNLVNAGLFRESLYSSELLETLNGTVNGTLTEEVPGIYSYRYRIRGNAADPTSHIIAEAEVLAAPQAIVGARQTNQQLTGFNLGVSFAYAPLSGIRVTLASDFVPQQTTIPTQENTVFLGNGTYQNLTYSNLQPSTLYNFHFDLVEGFPTKVRESRVGVAGYFTQMADLPPFTAPPAALNTSPWIKEPMPPGFWYDIAFGAGRFVAVANNINNNSPLTNYIAVLTPPNFLNWVLVTGQGLNDLHRVQYVHDRFFAFSNRGSVYCFTSFDGLTWTAHPEFPPAWWEDATYGNGRYVAVGRSQSPITSRYIYTSTDGVNWESVTLPLLPNGGVVTTNPVSIAYLNGVFVIAATSGTPRGLRSTDGISWELLSLPQDSGTLIQQLIVANNEFIGVSGTTVYSPDGFTWTLNPRAQVSNSVAPNTPFHTIAYGNGVYACLSPTFPHPAATRVMASLDGRNWYYQSTSFEEANFGGSNWRNVAFGGNRFVAVSGSHYLYSAEIN